MTLTNDIVEAYCAVDHSKIDSEAFHAAEIALADGLAVMVAATGLEPATRPFMDYAAATGAGPSTLIGKSSKVAPGYAALANGALAHAIDFEDTFEEGMIHPNASLIPAVLALAESEKASGEKVLAALVLGCDLACRMSLALDGDPAKRGWYHPPILSGFGATLGCSVLLGLDTDATRNALGLFAAQFMLGDELKRSPKSDLRAVREGLAARAAVDAALLARAGVEAVDAPLEGPSGVFRLLTGNAPKDEAFAGIGTRFWGPEVGVKRWPSCRGTHGAVVVAQRLHAKGIKAEMIMRVGVQATEPNDMLFMPREQRIAPRTAIDAKFSIPFVFASALLEGTVGLACFAGAQLSAQSTRELSSRVHLDAMMAKGPAEAIFTVHLEDGTEIVEQVQAVPFWRAHDIALPDLSEKIEQCLQSGETPVDLDEFLDAVSGVRAVGVGVLMALCGKARARFSNSEIIPL